MLIHVLVMLQVARIEFVVGCTTKDDRLCNSPHVNRACRTWGARNGKYDSEWRDFRNMLKPIADCKISKNVVLAFSALCYSQTETVAAYSQYWVFFDQALFELEQELAARRVNRSEVRFDHEWILANLSLLGNLVSFVAPSRLTLFCRLKGVCSKWMASTVGTFRDLSASKDVLDLLIK